MRCPSASDAPEGPQCIAAAAGNGVRDAPVDRVAVLVPAYRVRFCARFGSVHDDEPEVAPVRARLSSSLGPSSLAGDGGALASAVPFPSVPQEIHVATRRHGLAQHGEDMVVVALHDRLGPDRPRGRLRRWGPRSQTNHRFPRRAALARSIIADAMAGPAHGDVLCSVRISSKPSRRSRRSHGAMPRPPPLRLERRRQIARSPVFHGHPSGAAVPHQAGRASRGVGR